MNTQGHMRKGEYLGALRQLSKKTSGIIECYCIQPYCIRVVKHIHTIGRQWEPGQPRPEHDSRISTGVYLPLMDIYPQSRKYHFIATGERGVIPDKYGSFFRTKLKPFYDDNKNDLPECR